MSEKEKTVLSSLDVSEHVKAVEQGTIDGAKIAISLFNTSTCKTDGKFSLKYSGMEHECLYAKKVKLSQKGIDALTGEDALTFVKWLFTYNTGKTTDAIFNCALYKRALSTEGESTSAPTRKQLFDMFFKGEIDEVEYKARVHALDLKAEARKASKQA